MNYRLQHSFSILFSLAQCPYHRRRKLLSKKSSFDPNSQNIQRCFRPWLYFSCCYKLYRLFRGNLSPKSTAIPNDCLFFASGLSEERGKTKALINQKHHRLRPPAHVIKSVKKPTHRVLSGTFFFQFPEGVALKSNDAPKEIFKKLAHDLKKSEKTYSRVRLIVK